jgi:hypothetical protein
VKNETMKKMKPGDKRIFVTSFYSTLCVLLLIAGILEVDENSRSVGFSDNQTLFHQITGQTWQGTCNAVKIWYNQIISSITADDAEESR